MKKLIVLTVFLVLVAGGICFAQQTAPEVKKVWAKQTSVDKGTMFTSKYEGGEFTVGPQGATIIKIDVLDGSKCTPSVWINRFVKGYEQDVQCFRPPATIKGFRITQPGNYVVRPSLDKHSATGGCPNSTVVVYYTEP